MKLTKERIDTIFNDAAEQADYIVALYSAVVPRWDEVISVDGYVKCGAAMGKYIMGKAIAWDLANDVQTMTGGAWMNSGFSMADKGVDDWAIELPPITYRTGER